MNPFFNIRFDYYKILYNFIFYLENINSYKMGFKNLFKTNKIRPQNIKDVQQMTQEAHKKKVSEYINKAIPHITTGIISRARIGYNNYIYICEVPSYFHDQHNLDYIIETLKTTFPRYNFNIVFKEYRPPDDPDLIVKVSW